MTLHQSIRRALKMECGTDFARIYNFHPLRGHAAIARQLGVTREHLNRVLNGHRQSRSLLRRYQDLIQQHEQTRAADLATRN